MDKTKIIVVEDNIVYCEFVCNLLAREGFHTVQAFHLSTAKKYLQQAADGGFRPAPARRQRYRPAALDAQGGQDAALCHHDRLCRSAYGGGKHETRLAGLHTQAACRRQARPSAPYHIKRTARRTKPYAPVLA